MTLVRPATFAHIALLACLAAAGVRANPAEQCALGLQQGPAPADAPALGAQLEFLSWNIQKASNDGWQEDLQALTREVQLAFIQEAALEANLAAQLAQPMYQSFAAGYNSGDIQTGVLTLSAGEPTLNCALTAWEPWLGTPKATAITELPLAGHSQRLLAINLHAVNFTVGLEEFGEQIGALAAVLARHSGPVIIAGDFNTWSGRRQALVDEVLGDHGLAPVQFSPDERTSVFGRALDHVYIRGLRAVAARSIAVDSSDHNPLLVSLEVIAP